jgi:hypothetical protein
MLALSVAIAAVVVAAFVAIRSLEEWRRVSTIQQQLVTFAPAIAAVQNDPRQLLVWYPLAQASRKLFPAAFAELDKATGGTFPFSKDLVQAAHAKCSADWLAWERANDAEFSLKAAEVQHEIDRAGQTATHASPLLRSKLAAIEQQKLERYQQRYGEYIKTAKAIAAFLE